MRGRYAKMGEGIEEDKLEAVKHISHGDVRHSLLTIVNNTTLHF